MPSRSINALRLFARRAIAPSSSFPTGSAAAPIYRDPTPHLSPFQDNSGSRRWFAQDARRDGPRYRNRTKHFTGETSSTPSAETSFEKDEPALSFAPAELVLGRPMLTRILTEIEGKGIQFILPRCDESSEEILLPFKTLLDKGVHVEFIIRGCTAHPELFKLLVSRSQDTLQSLHHLNEFCALSYSDGLRLIASYPDLAAPTPLYSILDALILSGIPPGRRLGSVIKKCPALLLARSTEELTKTAFGLGSFFSRKQVPMVLQRCPEVLLKSLSATEEKYEYIFYQMGLDGENFTDCARWAAMPIEEIVQRHEFLVKCGRFRTPDPKHPQLRLENPALRAILDTSDENFATQVAQVSLEEWVIYRSLCVKEAELATREHPFERVKPSMRKAYERRRKEAVEVPEHVFDVSANTGV